MHQQSERCLPTWRYSPRTYMLLKGTETGVLYFVAVDSSFSSIKMALPQPGYWSAIAQPSGWPGVASEVASRTWRQFFGNPAVAATIPLAGSWQAIKYIAQGASSHLVLFARVDQTNTIREVKC